jgi:hypothetical protein
MNEQAVTFYAKKFFPHLGLAYGRLAVLAALKSNRITVTA